MSIPFGLALILASLSGFIALVYEIIWARVYSFTAASRPVAFGMMLGSYLLGLALGSLWSRRWQQNAFDQKTALQSVSRLTVVSNLIAFFVVPLISWCVLRLHWAMTLPLVTLGATSLGILLPLLCHVAIPADGRSGARMSYIYIANIIGSGLGSLLAGFVFMEWFTLWQIALGLLLLAVLISVSIGRVAGAVGRRDPVLWVVAVVLAISSPWLHEGLYERLQFRAEYDPHVRFAQVVESRHGVITVDHDKVIYGGGIYDGIIETRPKYGGGLLRPYFVSAIHPAPREILVIGMSGGAWTQILAHHPQSEHVTVVEIDAGYLRIIRAYPEVASLLSNPKVQIHIDDGRRWLRRNPDRLFDVIVMNTTFHWREYASALLGREFLEMAKNHLKPGGFVMWNCTGSARALSTAMAVFPHTMMVSNNCVGSVSPFEINEPRWRSVLMEYKIDGHPVFDLTTDAGRRDLEVMLSAVHESDPSRQITNRAAMEKAFGTAPLITDDNLGDEYGFSYKNHRFLFW